MGLYVNPTNTTKEEWRLANARRATAEDITGAGFAGVINEGRIPLVWMDNGPFSAVGVAFNQREAEDFARHDGRAKLFFTVPRDSLADANSGVGEKLLQAYKL